MFRVWGGQSHAIPRYSALGFGVVLELDNARKPTVLWAPKGPCTQIVYTLAPKYLHRDYFKAKVRTIRAHRPFKP